MSSSREAFVALGHLCNFSNTVEKTYYNGSTEHNTTTLLPQKGDRGGTVVKVLCYKSEGRCLDPSWCHWDFSLI